ncbi:hypothetical protein YC2023_048946 [Brassica napus]
MEKVYDIMYSTKYHNLKGCLYLSSWKNDSLGSISLRTSLSFGLKFSGTSEYAKTKVLCAKSFYVNKFYKSFYVNKTRLRGTVAVNLTPATKIEDIADMMTKGSKCRWGNFIGLVVFPLWIRCEDDPLKYIRRARATMDKKKISMEPLISYGILKLIMKIFGEKALIIHYVSYVDKLIINLAVDTAVIPDPHLLCDDLVESLNIIKLAALEKGLHKMEV